ncbi:MAG: hypothetical protein HYX93_00715, partial [Chloroflexi bacterium]|nr:hypothetical protein [Chloroflexota bacterium]
VMQDGRIVQRGNHEELIQVPGPYREIYELQLRPQEEAEEPVHVLARGSERSRPDRLESPSTNGEGGA